MAAHPQQKQPAAAATPEATPIMLEKNPFPTQMTVPGLDGTPVVIELAVVDGGIVYAPRLDEAPIGPAVRSYVSSFCTAWSSSVLTADKVDIDQSQVLRPRRAQLRFTESQLHMMLGLAVDERLLRVTVDHETGIVTMIVESPRLPQQPYWDHPPLLIKLPIAAYYEGGPELQGYAP